MVNGTILIFVKAPVAGTVKTRLAAALGAEEAARLYRAMALDTLDAARRTSAASVTVAYQGHPAFPDPSWLAADVSWFAQEGSDLGQRLTHATQRVFEDRPGPVLVIGSDLPALTPALLASGFDSLRRAPVVLGPAKDGGYYLIGLTRPAPALFEGIGWSGPKVLEQTQQILQRQGLHAEYLPMQQDLDTPEDLAYLNTLEELPKHLKKVTTQDPWSPKAVILRGHWRRIYPVVSNVDGKKIPRQRPRGMTIEGT